MYNPNPSSRRSLKRIGRSFGYDSIKTEDYWEARSQIISNASSSFVRYRACFFFSFSFISCSHILRFLAVRTGSGFAICRYSELSSIPYQFHQSISWNTKAVACVNPMICSSLSVHLDLRLWSRTDAKPPPGFLAYPTIARVIGWPRCCWRRKQSQAPWASQPEIHATPIGEKSIIFVLGKGRHNVAAKLICAWSFAPLFMFPAPPRAPPSHARLHSGEQNRKHGMLCWPRSRRRRPQMSSPD
jgi:hypothetical protein